MLPSYQVVLWPEEKSAQDKFLLGQLPELVFCKDKHLSVAHLKKQ